MYIFTRISLGIINYDLMLKLNYTFCFTKELLFRALHSCLWIHRDIIIILGIIQTELMTQLNRREIIYKLKKKSRYEQHSFVD